MKFTLTIENHGVKGLPNPVTFTADDLLVAVQSEGEALLACPAPNKVTEALTTWFDWKSKGATIKLNLMLHNASEA